MGAGLEVTIHVGEGGGAYAVAGIREVVSTLRPSGSVLSRNAWGNAQQARVCHASSALGVDVIASRGPRRKEEE